MYQNFYTNANLFLLSEKFYSYFSFIYNILIYRLITKCYKIVLTILPNIFKLQILLLLLEIQIYLAKVWVV